MAGLMQEAGFVDVVEKRFRWPVGDWSGDVRLREVGRWNLRRWYVCFCRKMPSVLGRWSVDDC